MTTTVHIGCGAGFANDRPDAALALANDLAGRDGRRFLFFELLAERIGTSSVTIGHRIVSDDGGTLFADGHVVMVWIDRATGRPTALPDQVKAITGAL